MILQRTVALLLALGVFLGWLRFARWWLRAPVRSRGWRMALLLIAQPITASLFYLTLFPPPTRSPEPGTLTVLTRGANASVSGSIALPEAKALSGVSATPDLATALRQHPGVRRLHILGEGLEARDAPVARGMAITFTPPATPRGLVALAPPAGPIAPGAAFRVSGAASSLDGGSAALLDPAGRQVDGVPLGTDGSFALVGAARVAGVALFRLRLRDAGGTVIEEAPVPLWIERAAPTHVLYLAGAPGAESKYWRRWASDASLDVQARFALGGGLELGDPAALLTAAALAHTDLMIVDERSWAALGAIRKAAVTDAVKGGMGLLLRVTGPLPPTIRQDWTGFGLPLATAVTSAPVRLPPGLDGAPPALSRRVALAASPGMVTALRDAGGGMLLGWHALGRGRVGVWTVADEFALVPTGFGARFGELWARTIADLARAGTFQTPFAARLPAAGEVTALCALPSGTSVVDPDRHVTIILPDPAAGGCAGYWPRSAGWHLVRAGAARWPFYVFAPSDLLALRAVERRNRTLALMRLPSFTHVGGSTKDGPGPAWPWLICFLVIATFMWWFERAPLGRLAR